VAYERSWGRGKAIFIKTATTPLRISSSLFKTISKKKNSYMHLDRNNTENMVYMV